MNENQEIKRTSKSHLKALVKKGREQAQKEKEADDRDRAERAIRRKTRQGSNYDPSEDDLEDSYSPEGEETLNEKDYGKLIKLGVERAKQKRLGRATARQIKTPNTYREIKDKDAEGKTVVVKSSYEPEGEETLSELKKSTLQSYVRKVSYKNPETGRGAVKPGRGKGYTKAQERLTAKNAQELGYDGPNIRKQASKVQDSYSPEGETTLSEVDSSTTEFVDRVMNRVNEAFDKMPERQLKDYDKKAKKPMHGREASKEEREEMAAKFQKSRGGASTKTKKMRDLRLKAK